MIDTIIISGGNIQNGFALDFLKKRVEESRGKKIALVAADKGMVYEKPGIYSGSCSRGF